MSTRIENEPKIMHISVAQWHELTLGGENIPVTLMLDGESMRPLIRKQKDYITVIPVYRKLKKGDIVLFVRRDGAYVVHRVNKIKDETVITIGDNCVVFDAEIPVSDVWGIVVKEERNGKTISLDSALSRAFGIARMLTRPLRSFWIKAKRYGVRLIRRLEGRK